MRFRFKLQSRKNWVIEEKNGENQMIQRLKYHDLPVHLTTPFQRLQSNQIMPENKEQVAKLCLSCHVMYGNEVFNHMCSMCYKQAKAQTEKLAKSQEKLEQTPKSVPELTYKSTQENNSDKIQQKIESSFKPSVRSDKTNIQADSKADNRIGTKGQKQKQQKQEIKKEAKKCLKCQRKVGMLGYSCKHCSEEFCKLHRLPEDHDCGVDFISLGRKQLKIDNPTLKKTKVDEI